MKIQRSDRQNKETSNINKTDMFNSIDHEIEESISRILKNHTSGISQTSDEKSNASDSYRGALIQEIASRMNRPYESDLRLFTLDQISLWLHWEDIIVYQVDQWNELIDYLSRSDIERRAYKEVIYSLKSQISQKENDIKQEDREQDKEQDREQEHKLKVIDNNENIEDIKRIEDLYKK